ncbi:major facilitator superfamily permease [Klebsiella pneumoniae]|uniref:Major facilitator superfamily permease n=1 Tax=Klebsiella pneumoniae TaxID=573 RepID=A0A2X3IP40_KLEPN|nr:major facilitator superfamily permease [Klebsiella pneumoniae]
MMTSWHGILIMRALIGLSLSGVAAVGMTYLSEEIHPVSLPFRWDSISAATPSAA